MGVALSEWFYNEAVAKGGRLDVPSEREVVIFIQFHREDGPFRDLAGDLANEFGCSVPFGLHSSPNKMGSCHPVAIDETERGIRVLCVELVDPEDCAGIWLVGPYIPPDRELYRSVRAVRESNICVGG